MEKTNPERAPGSRFVKGRKQEALAEIEGWVGGSREEIIKAGAARVSSQPSKNITEQKMLDSKLYDMSKQRFNFILQCQWQRKLFLEKQKQKTTVMRDLLRNVDVTAVSNPFQTDKGRKRGATVIPGDRSLAPQLQTRQKAFTTVPGPRNAQEEIAEASTFITQKAGFLSQVAQQRLVVTVPDVGDDVTNSAPESGRSVTSDASKSKKRGKNPWPMSDTRYLRLSEVLSENYPKEVRVGAHPKNPANLFPVTAGYQ